MLVQWRELTKGYRSDRCHTRRRSSVCVIVRIGCRLDRSCFCCERFFDYLVSFIAELRRKYCWESFRFLARIGPEMPECPSTRLRENVPYSRRITRIVFDFLPGPLPLCPTLDRICCCCCCCRFRFSCSCRRLYRMLFLFSDSDRAMAGASRAPKTRSTPSSHWFALLMVVLYCILGCVPFSMACTGDGWILSLFVEMSVTGTLVSKEI